jgi:hypothetical protein
MYDSAGNRIEEAYLDPADRPVRNLDGYAIFRRKFNAGGKPIEFAYFDEKGNSCRSKDGYSRTTRRYDAQGRMVEETEWGYDGAHGYARRFITYDDRGNITSFSFLDERGNLVKNDDGYARRKVQFDDHSNLLEAAFFDPDGKPVRIRPGGYARVVHRYDPQHSRIGSNYFDTDGAPLQPVVVVRNVLDGFQAKRLGIQPGDQLLTYGGQKIENTARFIASRASEPTSGGPKNLEVKRDDKSLSFPVQPGQLGMTLEDQVLVPPTPSPTPDPKPLNVKAGRTKLNADNNK